MQFAITEKKKDKLEQASNISLRTIKMLSFKNRNVSIHCRTSVSETGLKGIKKQLIHLNLVLNMDIDPKKNCNIQRPLPSVDSKRCNSV